MKTFAKIFCILLTLFVVGLFAHTLDEKVEEFIAHVPEGDRLDFMKYSVRKGYERHEKKGKDHQYIPTLFEDIYIYHMVHHRVDPSTVPLQGSADVVCFPKGCVDITDSSVHP